MRKWLLLFALVLLILLILKYYTLFAAMPATSAENSSTLDDLFKFR